MASFSFLNPIFLRYLLGEKIELDIEAGHCEYLPLALSLYQTFHLAQTSRMSSAANQREKQLKILFMLKK